MLSAVGPRVELYPAFLSDAECEHLLRLALVQAQPSAEGAPSRAEDELSAQEEEGGAHGGAHGAAVSSRLSALGSGSSGRRRLLVSAPEDDPLVRLIEERCALATNIPAHALEAPLAMKYSAETKYLPPRSATRRPRWSSLPAAADDEDAAALTAAAASRAAAFPSFIDSGFPTRVEWASERREHDEAARRAERAAERQQRRAERLDADRAPSTQDLYDEGLDAGREIGAHHGARCPPLVPSLHVDTNNEGTYRCATVIIYLNDVPEGMGGETRFPIANTPIDSVLRVAGRAALATGATALFRDERDTAAAVAEVAAPSPPPATAPSAAPASRKAAAEARQADRAAAAAAEAELRERQARVAQRHAAGQALLAAAESGDVGLHVQPTRGSACVFWTLDGNGIDASSWHNGAKLLPGGGGKWIAQKFKELPAAHRDERPLRLPPACKPPHLFARKAYEERDALMKAYAEAAAAAVAAAAAEPALPPAALASAADAHEVPEPRVGSQFA